MYCASDCSFAAAAEISPRRSRAWSSTWRALRSASSISASRARTCSDSNCSSPSRVSLALRSASKSIELARQSAGSRCSRSRISSADAVDLRTQQWLHPPVHFGDQGFDPLQRRPLPPGAAPPASPPRQTAARQLCAARSRRSTQARQLLLSQLTASVSSSACFSCMAANSACRASNQRLRCSARSALKPLQFTAGRSAAAR